MGWCYIVCVAGLRELTLSANPGISSKGWARLAIAVAHSSQLRVLNLDYNPLGTCFTHYCSHCSGSFSGSKCSCSLCRWPDRRDAGSGCGIEQNTGGSGSGRNWSDQSICTGGPAITLFVQQGEPVALRLILDQFICCCCGIISTGWQMFRCFLCRFSWTWSRTTRPVCAFWFWPRTPSAQSCSSRSVTCCLKARRTTEMPRPWGLTPLSTGHCCQSGLNTSQSEECSRRQPGSSPTAVRVNSPRFLSPRTSFVWQVWLAYNLCWSIHCPFITWFEWDLLVLLVW